MQSLVHYADELVTKVGPRPSGSNGEHESAELIAENLENLGLDTWLQDFSAARNTSWLRMLYFLLGVIAAELLFLVPTLTALAFILAIIAVVLLVMDLTSFAPLFSLLSTSSSQNVIARYVPEGADPRRKVIVVAHYDAGKTQLQGAPSIASYYPLILKALYVCLVALVLITLFSLFPLPEIVLLLLSIIGLIIGIVLLIATLIEAINLFMPYSHGANSNASGIAALMGVAETLMGGRKSDQASGVSRTRREAGASTRSEAPSRTKAREGAQRGASGPGGLLFTKAKDLLGIKPAPQSEVPEQSADFEYDHEDYDGPSVKTRIRSGAPTTRGEQPQQRADAAEDRGDVLVREERMSSAGTADLGAEVTNAARGVSGQDSVFGAPASREQVQGEGRPGAYVPTRSRIERGATTNPAIRVRETLAEREEQERSLQEQAGEASLEASGRTKDGLPAWFVEAREAANKEMEKTAADKETTVTRSRYAEDPAQQTAESQPRAAHKPPMMSGAKRGPLSGLKTEAEASQNAALAQEELALSPEFEQQLIALVEPAAAEVASAGVASSEVAFEEAAFADAAPREPLREKSPLIEPPTTLNADFSGIDRLSSDPLVTPTLKTRLPSSASTLEQAMATPTPVMPTNDNLRNLPTLQLGGSGSIPTQQAALDQQMLFNPDEQAEGTKMVSNTGSFAPLGATGIMKPVGEELLQYHEDEGDIYLDDADESAAWNSREGSRSQEPRIMDIPKSRSKSFFGGLGDRLSGARKVETHDTSAASWLGVEEDFDARSKGSEIGGWENFSEDDDDDWKGGAFGGEAQDNERALYAFSSELIDKEVWIVAVGAHESKNAGIKKLLAEYERELKSALVINLDSVGAGNLFYTMAEGSLLPKGTDHRLQGLIKSAANAVGVSIAPAGFTSYTTDAAEALTKGFRAISIMGLKDKLPVGWRWSSDRLEILEEKNLQAVTDVVVEVIKSV
ncbi:MAG: M28 family peptidase [Coriobacteriales bacterium]|jgi:hypothetical protein|nr:M28 family peptidase [Coriobacteriales bacterium]